MDDKKRIPAIRFKGFTDSWEQRKLGDCCKIATGKLDANEMDDNGFYNFYTSGVEVFKINKPAFEGPAITIAGNGANVGYMHLAEGKFNAYQRTYVLSEFLADRLFLNIAIGNKLPNKIQEEVRGSGIPYIVLNMLTDLDIPYPISAEQIKTGFFFNRIDNLITLHQRKFESLKKMKKALLEKMFPRDGENIPSIRFKGFTDSWEQRKLGDVGKARSGVGFPDTEQGGTSGLPFFKVSDMNSNCNENEMTIANNYVTAEQISAHKWSPITELPAIFFAKVGAAVMLNRKRICYFPFLLDNNTMAYSLDSTKWNSDFAKAKFDTIDLTSLVQIGALPSYNSVDVETIKIQLPNHLEQAQIGSFFKNLDNLITLHQRKLEKFNNIKKAMLEKMFV